MILLASAWLEVVFLDDDVEVPCVASAFRDVVGEVISTAGVAEADDMTTVLGQGVLDHGFAGSRTVTVDRFLHQRVPQ